uniref:Large ribosomal subunit protein uL18c n=1 Tax=Bostrychia simpliciuscula TaxID=324754 RepID=A0A1Z1M8L8_9FLOR|nr:ribosomal protein L18 [Bostrychia simpliciuscula]ARW62135.1 ribosomal protein L18 [Bostrychia simpliciuscula]
MKIKGTIDRPRLYVFKSNKHIYVQIIDDYNKKVLTSSSTISKEIKDFNKVFANCKTAKIVGQNIANKLRKLNIEKIVFDRGHNIYHGQIKELANATRNEGINF